MWLSCSSMQREAQRCCKKMHKDLFVDVMYVMNLGDEFDGIFIERSFTINDIKYENQRSLEVQYEEKIVQNKKE